MVGLVIVSHSRALAEALEVMVRQVASNEIPIKIAAGAGPDGQELGTNAVEIAEAIQAVYSPDGVLLLMDLGSAILSAEIAVELLPPEFQKNIRFCAAPLVEGAVTAAVQIGLGSDLNTVCREAQDALQPKIEQLSPAGESTSTTASEDLSKPAGPQQEVVLTLENLHGLHARPAARFVQTASRFEADIHVRNISSGKGPVSARSLNALATLGAVRGNQIQIIAEGAQAALAVQALTALVEDQFGERSHEAVVQPPSTEIPAPIQDRDTLQGIPVSEGYAVGPLYRYQPSLPPIPQERNVNPGIEWSRLQSAIEAVRADLQKRRTQLGSQLGEEQAAIFDAHLLILQDPEMMEGIRQLVFEEHDNAARAWDLGIKQAVKAYQELPDPYLRQRAADVQDVGNQVLLALSGGNPAVKLELPGPVILQAQELTPTETTQLEMDLVLGIVTTGGGATSHSAILARALGIPAVAGIDPVVEKIVPGTILTLDGFLGLVKVEPDQSEVDDSLAKRTEWLEKRKQLQQASREPAVTSDGRRIEVAANVGNLADARRAVENGAEGIGLLRTEFLFLTRSTPPSEQEQIAALSQIGEVMGDHPIIVRTLDVGGDKDLPYIQMPHEANPFLGTRAIRLLFREPVLFLSQLRAILRAGSQYNFRIMFPMIATLEEVEQAHMWLERAHQSLLTENLLHRWPIDSGIMVEIPSSALLSPLIAPQVDFFSIGTNDLTQYTMAAERGNPNLPNLADGLHPSVLTLIKQVTDAAHHHGKWVGVCGELAGDPLAAAVLVGLGVDELSMNPGSIPAVKALLREIDTQAAHSLASQALQAKNALAVRQLAVEFQEKTIRAKG